MERREAFELIVGERDRQERLAFDGRFVYTAASHGASNPERLAMLAEELGEVAGVVLAVEELAGDRQYPNPVAALREEVTQLAAIAVAWLEALPSLRGEVRAS